MITARLFTAITRHNTSLYFSPIPHENKKIGKYKILVVLTILARNQYPATFPALPGH